MDRIDRKIIDILQTNARAPLKEIADRVFLSSPAVSARIAKLEKDGVLTGYQAQVAPLKLGQLVKAFINLDMDPKLKPEFYPYIQSCGNVVECNCVTGDYSMLIEVLFGTTQELDTFINHLQQFGHDGSGSIHWVAATLWPHADADRVFHPGGAPRPAGERTGGRTGGGNLTACSRLFPSLS